MPSIGRDAWSLIFEKSPIFLTAGVVDEVLPVVGAISDLSLFGIPFGAVSLMALANLANTALSVVTGDKISLDNTFATFKPTPGTALVEQEIAHYPFANMQTAANAVITKPKRIGFEMTAPSRGRFSYWTKLPQMTALQFIVERHNRLGGRYHLVTPAVIYLNCLMTRMYDTSSSQTKQPQSVWTLEFEKPLVTISDAETVEERLGTLLGQVNNGQKILQQLPT